MSFFVIDQHSCLKLSSTWDSMISSFLYDDLFFCLKKNSTPHIHIFDLLVFVVYQIKIQETFTNYHVMFENNKHNS